jgi:4-aminobutyrate aminotransferase-like enzyme
MEALRATPGVADVRGLGMLVAAELADGTDAKAVASACLDAGLVLNAVTATALRLAPPLNISDDDLDEGVAILAKVLAS